MKILIVGPRYCGKDEACQYLASLTGLKFKGTSSFFGAPFVAEQLGISPEQAYRERKKPGIWEVWDQTLSELHVQDALALIRPAIKYADITGGVRDKSVMDALKKENLFDLIIWLERDVDFDPTLKFGPEVADIIIENNGSLEDFHLKLQRIARALCM